MTKLNLNFFGEEVTVDTPKDIPSLRAKISEKYLFSPSDAAEIILYYIKDNKKTYIINGNDFSTFKSLNIPTIFLDINQNSKIYLDSTSQLEKEKEKMKKELDELNHKFKQFSKKKEKVENAFEEELKQINMKIMEMNKKKCEIIKKKDIELIKMLKEKEHYEGKIYYLQKKLSLPITVEIPKEEKSKEESLKSSPKQLLMAKSFQNNCRYTSIRNYEIQKRKEFAKCRNIASAKAVLLNIEPKIRSEIEICKIKAAKEAKIFALKGNLGEKEKSKNFDVQNKIQNAKIKSIAKAKLDALKVGQRMKEESQTLLKSKKEGKKENKSPKNDIKDKINYGKIKSIERAQLEALKIGERMRENEVRKNILLVKAKSIANAKSFALKVAKRAKEDEIQQKMKLVKEKTIEKAKLDALKVGQRQKEANIHKKINLVKEKSIEKAKLEALKVGIREKESKIHQKINLVKEKSIEKVKLEALKIGIREKESKIQQTINLVKEKSIEKAKKIALKIGQVAKTENEQKISSDTVSVFQKVNQVLGQTVDKVKEIAKNIVSKQNDEEMKEEEIKDEKEKLKKEKELKKKKEKEKKEQIDKIIKITKDTVNQINNLTKMVITQSNILIEQINNPEKNLNISADDIILRASTKMIKKKEAIHWNFTCDGCNKNPIRGNRYTCKGCPDFDFCEACYEKNKESHGHEFKKIIWPANTKRMGHKNTKYAQRGILHKNVRCDNCGLEPLVGYRYMCTICDDYNLCENCEEVSHHNHPFLKVDYSSLLTTFNNSYLKMNHYEPNESK